MSSGVRRDLYPSPSPPPGAPFRAWEAELCAVRRQQPRPPGAHPYPTPTPHRLCGFRPYRGLVAAGVGGGGAKVLEGCQGASGTTCISLAPAVQDAATTKGRALRPCRVPTRTTRRGWVRPSQRGRAAGDCRVAGPRAPVAVSPPTSGLAHHCAVSESRETCTSQWSQDEATAKPSGRGAPARAGAGALRCARSPPRRARAPPPTLWRVPSPPHCLRLFRTCPGRPALGSAGWPQTRCPPPSRRLRAAGEAALRAASKARQGGRGRSSL